VSDQGPEIPGPRVGHFPQLPGLPAPEPLVEAPAEAAPPLAPPADPIAPAEAAPPEVPPADAAPPEAPPPRFPLRRRFAYPLALLAGLLYFLAFPGLDLWPFAFVALVPLFVALRGQPRKRATFVGWLAGFGMTMTGFYWLVGMLQEFSGFPTLVCVLLMAILCAYQSGRIGLCGFLHASVERKGYPAGLAFALAFAASELVYPLLFPWAYAATVHQVPVLLQTAELGGTILVAWVLIAANLVLAEPILARLERRRLRLGRTAALLGAVIAAVLYGAVRIPMVDAATAAAPKARVGLVQANLSLKAKREKGDAGLRRHLDLTRKLQQKEKLDLVVWSETSVVGVVREEDAAKYLHDRVTAGLGVPAIFGAVLLRRVDDERKYVLFNSALLSDQRGRICDSCRYDKQYLLMFGEYLPLGESFPVMYRWSPNSGRFSPGKSVQPLPLGDHQIAVVICYEDIIPSFVGAVMSAGHPDLIVNMTNDAWFGDTTEPWIHLALAKLRAIEHRRFLVRSTNSGVSAFVDPVGRVLSHTETFTPTALAQEVAWLRGSTVFGVVGNGPWWLATLLSLLFCFVPRDRIRLRRRRIDPPSPDRPADPSPQS
jgi:apolipoprotein N-acyltransferase